MKNWNLWFLVAILAVLYIGDKFVQDLKVGQSKVADKVSENQAILQTLSQQMSINETERLSFYKLQKNQDVWAGTGCAQCHNTLKTSLPINRISVAEAMEIVREGTERTKALGMPTYTSRGTRDRNSITDADLKVRLDALYIKEFLDVAEVKEKSLK